MGRERPFGDHNVMVQRQANDKLLDGNLHGFAGVTMRHLNLGIENALSFCPELLNEAFHLSFSPDDYRPVPRTKRLSIQRAAAG